MLAELSGKTILQVLHPETEGFVYSAHEVTKSVRHKGQKSWLFFGVFGYTDLSVCVTGMHAGETRPCNAGLEACIHCVVNFYTTTMTTS